MEVNLSTIRKDIKQDLLFLCFYLPGDGSFVILHSPFLFICFVLLPYITHDVIYRHMSHEVFVNIFHDVFVSTS